jgi:hypothetical protein
VVPTARLNTVPQRNICAPARNQTLYIQPVDNYFAVHAAMTHMYKTSRNAYNLYRDIAALTVKKEKQRNKTIQI